MFAVNTSVDRRTTVVAATVVVVAALGIGVLGGLPTGVPPAFAFACQLPHPACAGGVFYRTAAVEVTYVEPVGEALLPVEPLGDTDWNIMAYWNSANQPCTEATEMATASVSWSGTSWTVSNVNTTTNITSIDVCPGPGCGASYDHAFGYTLIAKVWDPKLTTTQNLRKVVFTTTSVSDGEELDTSACTLGSEVSPTSQSFSQTDNGAFECGYGCLTASGPSLAITYE